MLCYLLSASDRSPTHQSSDQVEVSLSAFSEMNDAESDHMTTRQPQALTAGSSVDQRRPEEGATIPSCVLISKPGSLLKTQHQENSLSYTAPLHLVAYPMPYSNSLDMFCQIHPTHLSISPTLVPLTCTGSTLDQIQSSHAQRSNDAVFMPANIAHFLGSSPVCTHTPTAFSILPAQGLYLSHGSKSSLNQAPEAPFDPVSIHRPAAPNRYIKLGML